MACGLKLIYKVCKNRTNGKNDEKNSFVSFEGWQRIISFTMDLEKVLNLLEKSNKKILEFNSDILKGLEEGWSVAFLQF